MLLPIELNCGDAAETNNKDNHSLLTSSSTATATATTSPPPTTPATFGSDRVSDLLAG